MTIEQISQTVESFVNCINNRELAKAQKLDAILIKFLGIDNRVLPRKGAPPRIQIMYAYNRAMLRLNNDEIEQAALAMIDVAEIIRCYGIWDDIYFVLWMLAENTGKHNQFDYTHSYACDNLMMAVVSQIRFPAMSLSLFWKAEKLFIKMGRQNTAGFIKGLKKLQYSLVASSYKDEDSNGAKLFKEKADSLGDIKMRVPAKDEPKYFVDKREEPIQTDEKIQAMFEELNEHLPTPEEWGFYWDSFPDYNALKSFTLKKYGQESVKDKDKLPNLLEVLEAISYDEEKYALIYDKSPLGFSFPIHDSWSYLNKVVNSDNELLFLPRCRVKNWYYRGQTSYYEECNSALYRGLKEVEIFKERLKLCEFTIIVNKHPAARRFELGLLTNTRSDNVLHNKIHIDADALAQHYGICTEYMDVTTDKWTAAFFASCSYVISEGLEKDTYKIYKDDNKSGVFYIYQDKTPYADGWKLKPIGIQPNARPVKQSAYTIKMDREQNFDKMAYGVYFKHENRCSSIILKLFDESIGVMPAEVIEKKAKTIVNSNKFSKQALEATRKRFYPDINEAELNDLLKKSHVEIVDDPIVDYSSDELLEADKEFNLINQFIQYNTSNKLFMVL